MIPAPMLAALTLAQITPPPAVQAPAISFADGLRRLIGDAPNGFSRELGRRLTTQGEVTTYVLNFTIAGLTGCRVVTNGGLGRVACDAYRGNDPDAAQSAFDDFERQLHSFAGRDGHYFVDSFSFATEILTVASYWPSEALDVTVQKHASNGAYSVVFEVARNPS